MQYPLTIEQFQYPEFETNGGRKFITAFINAINNVYEKGRRVKNSGFCFTVEMVKGWYEKEYRSVCESEEGKMLFDIYTEYANEAWQQGVRASGEVVDIPTDEVKIYPCFAAHEPKPEKMQQKEQYFEETGLLQSQIILDSRGNLIDGYTSYLLAVKYGIQCVPIRYGRRQIVRASHKPGGKLYTWELPGILIDRVSAGDKAVVRTGRGVRVVTVAAVEEYAGNELEPLKRVIRVKRAERRCGMNKLNDLMQNEYEAMAGMDTPLPQLLGEALKIVRAKITDEEYLEIENNMYSSYNYADKFGFEQGFMRGIVVAKGGAI